MNLVAGGYPGGAMPSEATIMVEHTARRSVVRDALALLQDEGLVRRVRGTGTLVQSRRGPHPFDHLPGILEGPRDRPERLTTHLVASRATRAAAPVAGLLAVQPGGGLTMLEYLARFDGEAFLHGTSYLADPLASALRAPADSVDFYGLLDSVGIETGRATFVVESVVADAAHAPLLNLEVGAPLIRFQRTLYGPTGAAVEVGFVVCRADRVALVLERRGTAGGQP